LGLWAKAGFDANPENKKQAPSRSTAFQFFIIRVSPHLFGIEVKPLLS
jgi:hypothetical protein